MKKFTTRVLALIVALSMLLVSTAFAAERSAGSLTVGNFEITMGENTMSLPVYLTVGGGADIENERGFITASLETAEESALSMYATLENGAVNAFVDGMSYGFTLTLDQVKTLIEEQTGVSVEEMLAEATADSVSAEMLAALTALTESAAGLSALESEIDLKKLVDALKITYTAKGSETVPLFDVEVEANKYSLRLSQTTLLKLYNRLGDMDPAIKDYLTQYLAYINQTLAAQGERTTIEEILGMISVSATADGYRAKEGMLIDAKVTLTAEDESITLPITFITLTDEKGEYATIALDMDVDGEGLYMEIYADDFADETGDYANLSFGMSVYDSETLESEMDVAVILYAADTENGFEVGLMANMDEYGETISIGASYLNYETVKSEEADTYNGVLYAYMTENDVPMEITMDTCLYLSSIPEGELLTLSSSINPLEADEETLTQVVTDFQTVITQAMGVLMQDPDLAGLISSLMMGGF